MRTTPPTSYFVFLFIGWLTVFLFSGTHIYSQPPSLYESLGYVPEISMQNELEKQSFQQLWESGELETLGFLLASAPDRHEERMTEATQAIEEMIQNLESKKVRNKSLSKQIKMIHEEVYNQYFKAYKANGLFFQIFEDGSYQCVTGTALFSLILDRFDIPYSIIAHADHTNILVKQEKGRGADILLESTSGERGTYQIGPRFQRAYVDYLRRSNLIDQSAYRGQTQQEIFSTYFQQQEAVQIKELIGIHYTNWGLFLFEEGHTMQAIKALEKAYVFWRNEKVLQMLLTSHWKQWYEWEGYDMDGLLQSGHFIQLFLKQKERFSDLEEEVRGNFLIRCKVFWDQYYLGKIDLPYAQKGYDGLMEIVQDSMLRAEMTFGFHEMMGVALSRQSQPIPAISYYLKAYQIRPNQPEIQSNFINLTKGIYFELAVEGRNPEELEQLHQLLLSSFPDQAIQDFFITQYHLNQAKHYLRLDQAKEAIAYAKQAYLLSPDSIESQTIFASSIVSRSWEASPNGTFFGAGGLSYVEQQMDSFPFLSTHNFFLANYAFLLMNGSSMLFRQDRYTKAMELLATFEEVNAKLVDKTLEMEEAIVMTYWEGASYWIRKQQYSKAKSFFQQGIQQVSRPELAEPKLKLLGRL